jgi:hypothetical protein
MGADGGPGLRPPDGSGQPRVQAPIEVSSDAELVRELREGLADVRAGQVFPPSRSQLIWPPAGPLASERA